MIKITDLTKTYGSKKALNEVNLTIENGQIFGLLGHNGAGKSTTIKCLTSIIEPTSGSIAFDDQSLPEHRQEIKEKISYVPDTPDLFLQLSASEYWNLMASAYNIDPKHLTERLKELTDLFEMTQVSNETLSEFSHGMRQKVIIIGALLAEPEIWILDEPLQGLDPQAAFDLKELIKSYAQKGNTVIFSTHDLATAQQLCDQIAILKTGKLVYNGSVADLLANYPGDSLEQVYLQLVGRHTNDNELINELTAGDSAHD